MIGDKKAEAARTAARLEAAQRQVEEAMAELQSARAELAGAVVAPPDSNKPGVRQKLGRAGKVVGTTISRVIAIVALCVIAISVVVGPKVTPETSEQTAAREVRNKEEQAAREVRNREERLKSEALNLDILAEVYGTEYLKKSARDPKRCLSKKLSGAASGRVSDFAVVRVALGVEADVANRRPVADLA